MKKINNYIKLGLLLIGVSLILNISGLCSNWFKIILSITGCILIVKGNLNESLDK